MWMPIFAEELRISQLYVLFHYQALKIPNFTYLIKNIIVTIFAPKIFIESIQS